ncbi:MULTISPECIES: hypothetical protein [Pseudomonas]|uniref:HhH-GPD domain-containing protein n=2 Tax=Pseudomonas TaxID=286 RepID=A0ABM7CQ82_9PSED|nr:MULTISPECIES: hypothetical protein [Pseudomonas]AZL68274.1 hypothetical protein EJA05_11290 [Pseudomonas oryziphila]AZL73545.1 hypothetical protein EI693_10800 [Pseudomonas oryziphila]UVK85161.1 hypothetical protein LOY46_10950 [Pseudomonas sichuanensis]UVL91376.1 hypothetical protein LOY51_11060 [Pseudomonas sichuanensis]
MPQELHGIPDALRIELDDFIHNNDFPALYVAYNWGSDNFSSGFPEILALELDFAPVAFNQLSINQVRRVAQWGSLPGWRNVSGEISSTGGAALTKDSPAEMLIACMKPLKGIGPTYQSKLLRFAYPDRFGAIDTRIVRVFGEGDCASKQHAWLSLRADNLNNRWGIPAQQKHWPSDFTLWTAILRYIANRILEACPHPQTFIDAGLRKAGTWTCADVEMALFSFASQHIAGHFPANGPQKVTPCRSLET